MSTDLRGALAALRDHDAPTLTTPAGPTPDRKLVLVPGESAELSATVPGIVAHSAAQGDCEDLLTSYGLDPAEWIIGKLTIAGVTDPETGKQAATRIWARFTPATGADALRRAAYLEAVEAIKAMSGRPAAAAKHDYRQAPATVIVGLGDLQIGKIDNGGTAGIMDRTASAIEEAAQAAREEAERYNAAEVTIAFLGDHVEGTESQSGRVMDRSDVEVDEQFLLAQAVMVNAINAVRGIAPTTTAIAVPGNHGDTARRGGKGPAGRADSSWDTAALRSIASMLGAPGMPMADVRFVVPAPDEVSVTHTTADGTRIFATHGHHIRNRSKVDEWWAGQAKYPGSPAAGSHVLIKGHHHGFVAEALGPKRWVLQASTLEGGSRWYQHLTGTRPNQGILVAVVRDGEVLTAKHIRPAERGE